MSINRKYVHFALLVSTNKIVDGWEQSEDISYWSKIDLANNFPENKLSDFKVYHIDTLKRKGINPFDIKNWR